MLCLKLTVTLTDALNGVGAAKRMRTYSEIESIVKAFTDGKATGQTRFLGDLQYLVVKHSGHFKILRLDLTDPVSTWFPYLASKFNISDIDEYVLVINPAGASSADPSLPRPAALLTTRRSVRDGPREVCCVGLWCARRERSAPGHLLRTEEEEGTAACTDLTRSHAR